MADLGYVRSGVPVSAAAFYENAEPYNHYVRFCLVCLRYSEGADTLLDKGTDCRVSD
jgi:hypothetical protein